MKIVILNEDLRSEMQMYLALSTLYDVEIAQDVEDLLYMLDQNHTDLTFFDLSTSDEHLKQKDRVSAVKKIRQKHPSVKFVGICDQSDRLLQKEAEKHGIDNFITRPIKNRELLELIKGKNCSPQYSSLG